MAPEQFEGKDADARSDIFAFGALVFEMVTGRKAFQAKSHAGFIGEIMNVEPPSLSSFQPATPPALDRLVKTCLVKDPDERWQSAGDLKRELAWIVDDRSMGDGVTVAGAASTTRRDRLSPRASGWLGAVVVTAIVSGAVTWSRFGTSGGPRLEVTRTLASVAPAERLQALPADRTTNEGRPSRTAMTWLTGGRSFVFSGAQGDRQQLFLRSLEQLDVTPLVGTEGAANPFVSPDGRWIGFWSGGALRKVAVDGGGPATTICETLLGVRRELGQRSHNFLLSRSRGTLACSRRWRDTPTTDDAGQQEGRSQTLAAPSLARRGNHPLHRDAFVVTEMGRYGNRRAVARDR